MKTIDHRPQTIDLLNKIFLCISSGILLALSFSAKNLWVFAWIGLVPLLFAIEGKSPKQAFWLSYFCGIIFFAGTVYWVIHVTLLGLIALVLYLALYFGIFGIIARGLSFGNARLSRILLIPAAWVFLEFARSHMLTGFGWALLAYSQYKVLPVIQIADIFGAYGVSFLIVMVNVAIYGIIRNQKPVTSNQISLVSPRARALGARAVLWFLVTLFSLVATLAYGYYRLNEKTDVNTLKISVIQGNIPQKQKWDQDYKESILQKYIDLTIEASKDKPDLIIWPETAVPAYFNEDDEVKTRIEELAAGCGIPLLIGAPTTGFKGQRYVSYNSAVLLSGQGQVLEIYDKLHLVPFGEFIPFEEQLPFLRNYGRLSESGCFAKGSKYTIFNLGNKKFGVLVCFEDIFPGQVRRFVKEGAGFMVNITNDAWFKKTAAPYQHAQASVFRAIENRVPFVRAANTGLSCFIDPKGRIIRTVSDGNGREIEIAGFLTIDTR